MGARRRCECSEDAGDTVDRGRRIARSSAPSVAIANLLPTVTADARRQPRTTAPITVPINAGVIMLESTPSDATEP